MQSYTKAISLAVEAFDLIEDKKENELIRYFLSMSINALTDRVNERLGFGECEPASAHRHGADSAGCDESTCGPLGGKGGKIGGS